MPRIAPITDRFAVAPEHQAIFDTVAGRSSVGGPSSLMLYSPPLAEKAGELSAYIRAYHVVPAREAELVILAVAREKDCGFVWAQHTQPARKNGITDETIAIVRGRKDLASLSPDDAAIVDFVRQLQRTNRIPQALYDRLLARFGVPWLVELVGLIGYYGLITGILNVFELAPAPEADKLPV